MQAPNLGDLATHLASRRHTARLRTDLQRLSTELSTGEKADLAAHLGRDRLRLAQVDREVTLATTRQQGTQMAARSLALLQETLTRAEDMRGALVTDYAGIGLNPTIQALDGAAAGGEAAFGDLARSLNVQFGGRSLLAGRATDGPALAGAEDMLADLRLAAAGAATATDLAAAIDDWFDLPGGGFETAGYLGDDAGFLRHQTDEGGAVTQGLRADDPAFRDLFKAFALAALSGDGALPENERVAAIEEAGARLLSASTGVVSAAATLGQLEARMDEATAHHAAQITALGMIRNEMVAADPFETASALQEAESLLERHYIVTARLSDLTLTRYL